MFDQKRLCGDGTCTTRAEQLRDGDQQVDGEDEEVTHGVNRTIVASACKTAPQWRIRSYYDFATHRKPLRRKQRSRAASSRRRELRRTRRSHRICFTSQGRRESVGLSYRAITSGRRLVRSADLGRWVTRITTSRLIARKVCLTVARLKLCGPLVVAEKRVPTGSHAVEGRRPNAAD